jgi:hypothetical protein
MSPHEYLPRRVSGNDARRPPTGSGSRMLGAPFGLLWLEKARRWRRRLPGGSPPRSTPGPDPTCPSPGGACGGARAIHRGILLKRNQFQQDETEYEPHDWRDRKRDEDLCPWCQLI